MIKKEVLIALLVFALLFHPVSAQLADTPWPTFNGNNQRTGLSPYDTSHVDGTIKWKRKFGVGVGSSPIIGNDGTIYVGVDDGYFYALNPEDGTTIWKTKIGTPVRKEFMGDVSYNSIPFTASIAKDGTLYISSLDNYTYAISSDGKEKWRYPIHFTSDSWGNPTIGEDGTIYVIGSNPNAGLYALNSDGTQKWYYKMENNMFNSPSIDKAGTIYVAQSDTSRGSKLYAFNPDGTLKWALDTGREMESTPTLLDDGTIYVGSFSQDQSSAGLFSLTSKGVNWHYLVGGLEVMSTPSVAQDGTIYFGSFVGKIYAMKPDGTEEWSFDVGGTIESSITIGAEGTIYFGINPGSGVGKFDRSEDAFTGNFFALNPNGTEKWSLKGDRDSIVASVAISEEGTVYLGTMGGTLYAFGGPGEGTAAPEESESKKDSSGNEGPPATCPDGIWDENEQANPKICPSDNPTLKGIKNRGEYKPEVDTEDFNEPLEGYEGHIEPPKDPRGFLQKLADWFRNLFASDRELDEEPFTSQMQEDNSFTDQIHEKFRGDSTTSGEVCIFAEEPEEVLEGPVLSLPFRVEDYSTKYWGMVPYCADPWGSGNTHWALDFELKPYSRVYATESGTVTKTGPCEAVGCGEIIDFEGDGFGIGYSGLGNLQFKAGDKIEKGDYVGDVVQIPHGEWHLHIGIVVAGKTECPAKYMDEEFLEATKDLFAQSHYPRKSSAPCVCNC